MKCPYCKASMKHDFNFLPLAPKQRIMLNIILAAGPKGIKLKDLKKQLPDPNIADISVRTLIFSLNTNIKPLKIKTKGAIARLI